MSSTTEIPEEELALMRQSVACLAESQAETIGCRREGTIDEQTVEQLGILDVTVTSVRHRAHSNGASVRNYRIAECNRLACWLWQKGRNDVDPVPFFLTAEEAEQRLQSLLEYAQRIAEVCTAELIPALIGREGQRVALELEDGRRGEFIVGRSSGWLPYHVAKIDEEEPGVPLRALEFSFL
jgi:hypothetical protein